MEKIYLKTLLVAAGLASAVQLMAVDVPFAKEPVDGKTYILVSRSNPQRFWNRTGWDGAVYLQPFSNFNPANAITAHQQSDGTWTFTTDVTTEEKDEEGTVINTYTTTYYMSVPSGTDNLNINQYNPVSWIVEESNKAGYYLVSDLREVKPQKLQQDVCGVNKKYKLGYDNPKVDEVALWIERAQ